MGMQIIINNSERIVFENKFNEIIDLCEVFIINEQYTGISIPTKLVDNYGENKILQQLYKIHYYDLWSGTWFNKKET